MHAAQPAGRGGCGGFGLGISTLPVLSVHSHPCTGHVLTQVGHIWAPELRFTWVISTKLLHKEIICQCYILLTQKTQIIPRTTNKIQKIFIIDDKIDSGRCCRVCPVY